MDKLLLKAVQLGLGVADITREQVEKFVIEVTDNKDINTKEGRRMVDKILKDANKAKMQLDQRIESGVKKVLDKYEVVTKTDLKELERKIKKML